MLLELHDEAIVLVLEQLGSVGALGKVTLVCKRIAKICENDYVWARLLQNIYSLGWKGPNAKKLGGIINSTYVYTWGMNDRCQLGIKANSEPQPVPFSIPSFERRGVKSVACGNQFTATLLVDGSVWVCGYLSQCTYEIPTLVRSLSIRRIVQISSGPTHVGVCDADGVAYTWGYNNSGCLGLGKINIDEVDIPIEVAELRGEKIVRVSCGSSHTVFVTASNKAYSSGAGDHGCLGLKPPVASVNVPTIMDTKEWKIERAACGHHQTALITTTGQLLWCGLLKQFHTTAMGHVNVQSNTVKPIILPDEFIEDKLKFVQISVGHGAGGAVTSSGYLFTWGFEDFLGLTNHASERVSLFCRGVKYVCCGTRQLAFIDAKGQLRTYGKINIPFTRLKVDLYTEVLTSVYTPPNNPPMTVVSEFKKRIGDIQAGDIILGQHPSTKKRALRAYHELQAKRAGVTIPEVIDFVVKFYWHTYKLWKPVQEPKRTKKQVDPWKREGPGKFQDLIKLPFGNGLKKCFEDVDLLEMHKYLPSGVRTVSIGGGHVAVILVKQ